ncbi:MAG: hypothetical protein E7097_02495 [Bacteroides sp.]|nr:hypothetical protein [Bacteroides sp.]
MNVYFGSFSLLQDTTKRWKIFSILLDILKIEKIIYFVPNNKYYQLPFSFPKEFQHMILYRYEEDDMEKAIKEAVYKFNSPMCYPKMSIGKWNGEFIINDIYKKSRAYNPIYNIEYCNDSNVLVLIENDDVEDYSEQFAKHSLNILKKYANDLHYENRICFVRFDETFLESEEYDIFLSFYKTSIFYQGKFKSLIRYQPLKYDSDIGLKVGQSYSVYNIQCPDNNIKKKMKEYGLYYDPLISYINIKSKELYPIERGKSDISDFFLGNNQLNRLFHAAINSIKQENW